MKKILILMCLFVMFITVYCDGDNIYETEIIDDTYLPNIHLKKLIGADYFDVDTLFLRSDESSDLRVEIYYNNQEDFREITIDYLFELRSCGGSYGCQISGVSQSDMRLDSLSDKIIMDKILTPSDHKLFAYDAIIYDPDYAEYDLMRYKTLYIANPDSF